MVSTASIFEQFNQGHQNAMAPLFELNGIHTRVCNDMARQYLKSMQDFIQCSAESMQQLSHARGLEEVMSALSKVPAKMGPQMLENSQKMLDTMTQSATEYQEFFQNHTDSWMKKQDEVVSNIKRSIKEK